MANWAHTLMCCFDLWVTTSKLYLLLFHIWGKDYSIGIYEVNINHVSSMGGSFSQTPELPPKHLLPYYTIS